MVTASKPNPKVGRKPTKTSQLKSLRTKKQEKKALKQNGRAALQTLNCGYKRLNGTTAAATHTVTAGRTKLLLLWSSGWMSRGDPADPE